MQKKVASSLLSIIKTTKSDLLSAALFFLSLVFFIYFSKIAYYGRGIFDFPIFLDAAQRFIDTGLLYSRESDYSSGLAVYKFPPLFAAFLVEGFRFGIEYNKFFDIAYALHLIFYLSGILLLSISVSTDEKNMVLWFRCMSVGLLFFPMLDTNILLLQVDVYLFFLFSLGYFLFSRNLYFISGLVISLAAVLKIYPVVIMAFFLVCRRFRVFSGFMVGVIILLGYSVYVLGAEEVWWFFHNIFPVLLRELPAGGGANNISFPSLLTKNFINAYALWKAGTIEYTAVLSQISAGILNQDVMERHVHIIKFLVKIATFLCLVYTIVVAEYIMKKSAKDNSGKMVMGLLYGAVIVFIVVFMQNSWINYQIHLVIPIIMLLAAFNRVPGGSEVWLRRMAWCAVICLWIFAFLDSAQERVNNVQSENIPRTLVQLTGLVSGLTSTTGWGRCLSAMVLLYVCMALGLKTEHFRVTS